MKPLDITELKRLMVAELERRRCADDAFSYSRKPGGPEALYGLTGALNVLAALGLPLGDHEERHRKAVRILSYRDAEGHFDGGSGPGHGLHMVMGALHLLGEPLPREIRPLAPTDPSLLPAWLDRHDWGSTHKELCGQTIPLLAGGRVGGEWIDVFVRDISGRLDPDRPLETWCAPDDPSWRVISCVYHVFSAFDAGRIPYPRPHLLAERLMNLRWEDAPEEEQRTVCTDGDWAWLLLRLGEQIPHNAAPALEAIRRVSARRVRAWHEDREAVLALDTHHLFCYLWVTAVFQSCVRDHYRGGYVRDTLNDPALFRLFGPS